MHQATSRTPFGGLGPTGEGSHTVEERVDLPSIVEAAQRAALLLYRLGRLAGP